jgi:uncharacterized membrane protein YhaH (DUF805 family)
MSFSERTTRMAFWHVLLQKYPSITMMQMLIIGGQDLDADVPCSENHEVLILVLFVLNIIND